MTPADAAGGSGTTAWFTVLVSDPVLATLVCLAVGLLVFSVARRWRDDRDDRASGPVGQPAVRRAMNPATPSR